MLQWLYMYVASFCSQCFICFSRHMLQVCLFECCICFTHMLQVFYLDVAYVFSMFLSVLGVFASVSDACFKCFISHQTYVASAASKCFKSTSGVVSPRLLLPRLSVSSSSRSWLGIHRLLLFWMLVTFRTTRTPCGRAKRHEKSQQAWTSGRPIRPEVRALASPYLKVEWQALARSQVGHVIETN